MLNDKLLMSHVFLRGWSVGLQGSEKRRKPRDVESPRATRAPWCICPDDLSREEAGMPMRRIQSYRAIHRLAIAFAVAALLLIPAFNPPARAQSESDEAQSAEDQVSYEVETLSPEELDALKERLGALKERMFKSKASLKQLLDQIRMGSVSLISFSILHTHDVGPTFELETLSYTLDGFEIYSAITTSENLLDDYQGYAVYEGSLLPGEHILTVDMVMRGKGYGIFSYLNQYLFRVKGRYVFKVEEGDVVTLNVTSYDEGSFLTSLKDRLKVRFERE
ncbi:MAG: hypothetical protein M5R36_19345 [Deltaproteobacteria bacterium]|nr:hypothetical protein [Deltaproteobacteria bacterium]